MKKETTKLLWVHVRNIVWIKFHNKNMICFSSICLTKGEKQRFFLLTYNTVSELMTFQLLIFVPPIFVTMKENVRFVVLVKILHWKIIIIIIICDHHPSYCIRLNTNIHTCIYYFEPVWHLFNINIQINWEFHSPLFVTLLLCSSE